MSPHELIAALERELGEDWCAPLPPNPTPADEVEAWCQDAETVHQAHARVRARRRNALVQWHREQLAELGATA
jgi:hypothetical protein